MSSRETDDQAVQPTPTKRLRLADYFGLLIGALALFGLTAARTIQWQDFGQFTLRILEGELYNELGLALAHPLHFWLGQGAVALLPTEPAHAVALVSAVFGAITIANVFGCVVSVTGRRDAALVAALGLALANTFWRMSTMPECYTVTTALLSAELWALALFLRSAGAGKAKPYWLVAAFFVNGLGLANHNLALLTLPILGVVLIHALVRKQVCLSRASLAGLAWGVGASPYLMLVVIEAVTTGDTAGAIRSALFGNHYADNVLNASPSLKLIGISTAFTVLSFFNLTLLFSAAGLWQALRGKPGRALGLAWGAALGIHLLFVLRYNVIDQHTFLLPAYTILALFAGVGFASIADRFGQGGERKLTAIALVLVIAAPGVYLLTASAARARSVLGELARDKPYRDDYRYLFVPWGVGETSAKQMADHAVGLIDEEGVVIVGDSMARFAVRYTTLQQGMPDVVVYHYVGGEEVPWSTWSGRPVVFVPASMDDLPIDPPVGMRWRVDAPMYVLEPVDQAEPVVGDAR